MGVKTEKKLREEELDKFLEEQFLREERFIENEFPFDDSCGYDGESDEEIEDAYEKLETRLKEEGVYREESDASRELKPGKNRLSTYRIMKAAGIGIVCMLGVFTASMNTQAHRNFVDSVKLCSGDAAGMAVDYDGQNDEDSKAEYEARKEIELALGIEVPGFGYRPEGYLYNKYLIDPIIGTANVEYKCNDEIISLFMSRMSNDKKSDDYNEIEIGRIIEEINTVNDAINVSISKVEAPDDHKKIYIAQWKKDKAYYKISGSIDKNEFIKMIKNMRY